MASPQSNASDDDKRKLEQITFRFCSECSNMLYPKEDEHAQELQYTCRTCQYTEKATTTCVFRNVMNNAAGETAGVTQDVGSDPTVGNPSAFDPAHLPPRAQMFPWPAGFVPAKALCVCCSRLILCDTCHVEPAVVDYRNQEASVYNEPLPFDTSGNSTENSTSSVDYDDFFDDDATDKTEEELEQEEEDRQYMMGMLGSRSSLPSRPLVILNHR